MGICSRAAALFAAALVLPAAATAQRQPLYVLDLKVTAVSPPDLKRPLRLRLYSDAPRELASRLPGVVSVAKDHVVVDAGRGTVLGRGAPDPPHATFVIDYDAAPVAKLSGDLNLRYGKKPSDADLAEFVRRTLTPSGSRSFDVASQVATHKTGDCTEHAVLLAALARAQGLPARVVIGTLVASVEGELGGFGHAWTEIYRDGAWKLVDATPLDGGTKVAYVPEGLLEDESAGYLLGIMTLMTSGILRVEVIGNAP
jgi:transglutaminase/protease-like cytokinesis protein 3